MSSDPTRPAAWGNFLASAWGPHFPVQVETIALEYTKRFPDPIKAIAQADGENFEGALYPLPKTKQWAILYNPNSTSKGRINFTLAHELGHYLVHRASNPQGFECGEERLLGFDREATRRTIEQEADTFASYLLMPIDDFRKQVGSAPMSFDLLDHCVNRYEVSSTAAAIKWLDFTNDCAVLVTAINGFVLWCWRSKAAKRQNIYFPQGMEIPEASWAANPGLSLQAGAEGIDLAPSIWGIPGATREMAMFSPRHEMTISLLIFEKRRGIGAEYDDEAVEDVVDRFSSRGGFAL